MRLNNRNKQVFWYAPYRRTVEDYNDDGYQIGTHPEYGDPVLYRGNISPARGMVIEQQFGDDDQYDKVIAMGGTDLPIDEYGVLWVDVGPLVQTLVTMQGDPLTTNEGIALQVTKVIGARNEDGTFVYPFDYVVHRIAKGLPKFGDTLIAISKVNVS